MEAQTKEFLSGEQETSTPFQYRDLELLEKMHKKFIKNEKAKGRVDDEKREKVLSFKGKKKCLKYFACHRTDLF